MELRAYWTIMRRRWVLVIIPAAVVLFFGLMTYSAPGASYNVGIRFIVGQRPSQMAFQSDEERLANWLASEYIVNGLTDWVRGGQFAELVSKRLAGQGVEVSSQAIQGSIAADNTRSMMTVSMTYSDPDLVEAMAASAAEILVHDNAVALPQLGGEPAELVQLDQPRVGRVAPSISSQLGLPLRIALGVVAGVGLALVVDYVDPTVRGREELETMGLPVVGEIPKK